MTHTKRVVLVPARRIDVGTLTFPTLRIAFGLMLLTQCIPKALGIPHGSMADPITGCIDLIQNLLHLPAAPALGGLVMLLETWGALLIMAGIATRLFATVVAVEMASIWLVLGPTWPGVEYPVMMLSVAILLAMHGGATPSLTSAPANTR